MNFLTDTPCDSCDAIKTEYGTGAAYCSRHPSGDFECKAMAECARIDELAGQVASLYAAYHNPELRKELASSTADGFANLLYEADFHATFNEDAFLIACGLHEHVKARAA